MRRVRTEENLGLTTEDHTDNLKSNETLSVTTSLTNTPTKPAFPITTDKDMTWCLEQRLAGRRALGELKKGKATYIGSGLALSSLATTTDNNHGSRNGANNNDNDQQEPPRNEDANNANNGEEVNDATSPPHPSTPTRLPSPVDDETTDNNNNASRQAPGAAGSSSSLEGAAMTRERALWLMRTHPGRTYADRSFHGRMLSHLTHAEACEWRRRGYDDAVSAWLTHGKKRARDDGESEKKGEAAAEEDNKANEQPVASTKGDDDEDDARLKRSRRKDAQECASAIRHQMQAAATCNSPASPKSSMTPDTEGLSQLATMNHQFRIAVLDNLTFAEVAELYVRSRVSCQAQHPQQLA